MAARGDGVSGPAAATPSSGSTQADPHAKPGRPPGRPWRAEGLPPDHGGKAGPPDQGWRRWGRTAAWLIVYALLFALITYQDRQAGPPTIAYSEFQQQVRARNVAEVFARGESIQGELRAPRPLPGDHGQTYKRFATERPVFAQDDLMSQLEQGGATVRATPLVEARGPLFNLLISEQGGDAGADARDLYDKLEQSICRSSTIGATGGCG